MFVTPGVKPGEAERVNHGARQGATETAATRRLRPQGVMFVTPGGLAGGGTQQL